MSRIPKLPKGVTQADFDELDRNLSKRIDKYCLGDEADEESEDTKFFNKEMKKEEKRRIAEKKKFYGKAYGTKVGGEIKEESTDEEEEKPKEKKFTSVDAVNFANDIIKYFSNEKAYEDESLLRKLKLAKERFDKLSTIDVTLNKNIRNIFKENDVKDTDDYDEIQKALSESDIILHFKDADAIAKLDTKDPFGFLWNMIERKKDFKEGKDCYEVIKKDGPQKIMLISSGKLADKYRLIRKYIRNYMKYKGCPVERRDIKCMKNNQTGNMEILITPYYVKNSDDRNAFVASLKKYIEEIDGDEKVIKMLDKKEMDTTCAKGTKSNLLPYQKQYANGDEINFRTTDGMIDLIVSAINKECKQLDIKPDGKLVVNVNIVNNNGTINGNGINNAENSVVIINQDPYEKLLSDLKEQKPKWYITNKYVSKKEIFRRFMGMMDKEVSNNKFWQRMKDKLIFKEKRANNNGNKEYQIQLKPLW